MIQRFGSYRRVCQPEPLGVIERYAGDDKHDEKQRSGKAQAGVPAADETCQAVLQQAVAIHGL